MTRYELWYADDYGNRLDVLDTFAGFSYTKSVGNIGWLNLLMPEDSDRIYSEEKPDRQVHVWRRPLGGNIEFEGVFFLRKFSYNTDDFGRTALMLSGGDSNDLLARRIIAFHAESSQSSKTGNADDLMKEFIDENLKNPTDTDRDIVLSVDPDLADGPLITKAAAWKNVLSTLQQIQQTSRAEGTEVFFELKASTPTTFTFKTYINQPGADRTSDSQRPLIFGMPWGNVTNVSMDKDFSEEATYIFAGGQGQASARIISEKSDTDRIGASRYGRIEKFVNASSASTDNGVAAVANSALENSRPFLNFSATILNTPLTPYGGIGWRLGDKVTITHLSRQFDAVIREIKVTMNGVGQESIEAFVEVVS